MADKVIILNGLTLGEFKEELELIIEKYLADYRPIEETPKEELLNVHQVAELLHTTPQNIHAKKKAGKIPFARFGGKVLFKRSEVIDSLKSIKIKNAR